MEFVWLVPKNGTVVLKVGLLIGVLVKRLTDYLPNLNLVTPPPPFGTAGSLLCLRTYGAVRASSLQVVLNPRRTAVPFWGQTT